MLSNSSSFKDLVSFVIGIIDSIIPVLLVLILVIFMWAGVQYVYKAGESEGKGPEREALLWGLIALVVVFSIWGILRMVCSTLLGSSGCS